MSVGNVVRPQYSNLNLEYTKDSGKILTEHNSFQTCIHDFFQFKIALNSGENEIPKSPNQVNGSEYLNSIKGLHETITKQSNLSSDAKLEFCNMERFYMKLYLRNILNSYS